MKKSCLKLLTIIYFSTSKCLAPEFSPPKPSPRPPPLLPSFSSLHPSFHLSPPLLSPHALPTPFPPYHPPFHPLFLLTALYILRIFFCFLVCLFLSLLLYLFPFSLFLPCLLLPLLLCFLFPYIFVLPHLHNLLLGFPSFSFSSPSFFTSYQGLQILLMSGVSLTSALQILEAFWNIWNQVSDFPACGPGMYTLS